MHKTYKIITQITYQQIKHKIIPITLNTIYATLILIAECLTLKYTQTSKILIAIQPIALTIIIAINLIPFYDDEIIDKIKNLYENNHIGTFFSTYCNKTS